MKTFQQQKQVSGIRRSGFRPDNSDKRSSRARWKVSPIVDFLQG